MKKLEPAGPNTRKLDRRHDHKKNTIETRYLQNVGIEKLLERYDKQTYYINASTIY